MILFACHKSPFGSTPRGAENSVAALIGHLIDAGHDVSTWTRGEPGLDAAVADASLVITWGQAADDAARSAIRHRVPYILMVRFWKNVAILPAGNLMRRPIDKAFAERKFWLFRSAAAIVTNTYYAADVIKRWYGVNSVVSYVPILGQPDLLANERGALTIVTPEVYGEFELVAALAPKLPEEQFLVVNCDAATAGRFESIGDNVTAWPYVPIERAFRETKILLMPVYENDICGTRRVTIEAFRAGIPVIALNRCGMDEKVPDCFLLPAQSTPQHWIDRVNDINRDYFGNVYKATQAFHDYNTPEQLEVFQNVVEGALTKKQQV